MSASPTPIDALLATLSGKMGVLNESGTEADAAHTQEDRVIWIRGGPLGSEPCPYQLPGVKVIGRRIHPWRVSVYGATDLDVCNRVDALEKWIDLTVGPPQGIDGVRTGYRFAAGTVEPRGDSEDAAGYGCDVAVTLYTITLSEVYPTAEGSPSLAVTPQSPAPLTGTPITIP